MLRESPIIRQRAGEPRRRWFFSDYFDLIAWVSGDGGIVGFHLIYDRTGYGNAFVWREGEKVRHYHVDAGDRPGRVKGSEVLMEATAPADLQALVARFERECRDIDPRVASAVLEQLWASRWASRPV